MLEDAKLYEKDFDSSATRSWSSTTVVNGATYATGLFWQPLQNKDDPYTEIEESAEGILEGADLFALKPGKSVQFGVCSSPDGYKKGLPSLAVAVATALGDKSSLLAVFKVDNGWWYCCIRNDILLSDGDMLFLKEDDAKEQFLSMLAVPDWGRKIAPAEWKLEDVQSMDLDSLVANGVRARLQKIKTLRGPKLYAILTVSALVGFWLISTFVTDVLFAPKKKPMIVAPVKPKVVQPVVQKPVPMPWEKLKVPEEVLLLCYRDIMNIVKIMPPGWMLGGLNCSSTGATASWRRQVGRIAWVDKALNESGIKFSSRSVSGDGGTLIANTSFKVSERNSPPEYRNIELKNIINDLFQTLDAKISLSDASVTIQPPPQPKSSGPVAKKQPKPQPIIVKMVKYSFSAAQNPLVWKDILTKFSGLEVTNIKYDNVSAIWHYEGVIYVK